MGEGEKKLGKNRKEKERTEQGERRKNEKLVGELQVVAGAVNNSYFILILPEKFTFSATFYHSPYNGVPSSFF